MLPSPRPRFVAGAALLLAAAVGTQLRATGANTAEAAEHSMRRFLAQSEALHPYKAIRRLEARNGDTVGWLEAQTTYAPGTGFTYAVTAEGGSSQVRSKVLRAILDAERDLMSTDEQARSTLAPHNYEFQAAGVDANGLANVLLSPKRKESALIAGTLFLRPVDGDPVRLQGRLAKSPSFWIKRVDIVRTYDRIGGVAMPVALESNAQVRIFGDASLKMTYTYSEIDGRPVVALR
jgi:hypothetical protein